MAWRGSLSRSFISTARASVFRSSPSISAPRRLRPPPLSSPRFQSRRHFFSDRRTLGELGCAQSLMPLHSVFGGTRLTSHLAVNVRSCCELSHALSKLVEIVGTDTVEWKRWLRSAALPDNQMQGD